MFSLASVSQFVCLFAGLRKKTYSNRRFSENSVERRHMSHGRQEPLHFGGYLNHVTLALGSHLWSGESRATILHALPAAQCA